MRFLWQQRSAVHVIMGSAVCALWGWGLMFWTPAFLQRTYHMSVGEASVVTQNMHLWGGGIATVVTGFLMARGSMVDARRIVWLLAAGIGIATVASWVVYYTRDLTLARAMLWIFVPSIYFYIGPGFGLLNNLAPCRMRSEEHTSELQSRVDLVCRLLLEKKKKSTTQSVRTTARTHSAWHLK